jgi:hypothetical protein
MIFSVIAIVLVISVVTPFFLTTLVPLGIFLMNDVLHVTLTLSVLLLSYS